ncbi:YybH family protein [Caulobacter sp.]|uniref:YybH family protein n=1 Tax=Caulobacter sp. TaxID=78 RepID=UPI003BAF5AE0
MVHQIRLGGKARPFFGRSLAGLLLIFGGASARSEPVFAPAGENPFSALFGEWTLKDDKFQYVGDGRTIETQIIPNHHTECARVNTDRSILCVVKAGALNGHTLWTYDASKQQVHWLSHFGTERTGFGAGTFDKASNLTFKVSFTDEPEGSYRKYRYEWVSPDEYTLKSTQYDGHGRATGNWYGGTFVRLPASALAVAVPTSPPATGMAYSVEDDTQKVKAILKKIDADITDTSIYSEDVVHMAQGSRAITSKAELQKVLAAEVSHGRSNMTHEIVTLHSYSDMVLTRGRVKGTWHPANGGSPIPFETNNIITFRRTADGSLKVWHVIFNRVELERNQP